MKHAPLLTRIILATYPRAFRREFGAEMAQAMADLRRHRGFGRGRTLAVLVNDVARTAPRMRWESLMSRTRLIALAVVLSIGLMAVAVGSPVFLVVIGAAVALLALLVRSGDRPIVASPERSGSWYPWVIAGAASFGVGFVILLVDGNELSSVGWTVWMLSWATGTVLAVFGLLLMASRHLHRRA